MSFLTIFAENGLFEEMGRNRCLGNVLTGQGPEIGVVMCRVSFPDEHNALMSVRKI
jgi:hypothetical protein